MKKTKKGCLLIGTSLYCVWSAVGHTEAALSLVYGTGMKWPI